MNFLNPGDIVKFRRSGNVNLYSKFTPHGLAFETNCSDDITGNDICFVIATLNKVTHIGPVTYVLLLTKAGLGWSWYDNFRVI